MRLLRHVLLVSAATFVAAGAAYAQMSFTSTPRDTIIANVQLEAKRLFTFQQFAIGGDTLNLSWQRLEASVPPGWEANLCDNGTCYTNLPASGSMYQVYPGDYGLMALDIKPRISYGTATISYAVWDAVSPGERDTLTWIVHSNPTSMSLVTKGANAAFVVDQKLFIQQNRTQPFTAMLYDIAGKLVFSAGIVPGSEAIDVSFLNNGVYVLSITGPGYRYVQKIVIGSFK